MIDKISFNRCLSSILIFRDIPIDEEKNKAFYELMKNDFTQDEFSKICERICKEEELFGKYPTPPMFYKRKVSKKDEMVLGCEDFLDKVSNYLESGYISLDDKQSFLNSLSPLENTILAYMGGISQLWEDVHRDEYNRSIGSVLKELKSSYMEKADVYERVGYIKTPSLEDRRRGMFQIGQVLKKDD